MLHALITYHASIHLSRLVCNKFVMCQSTSVIYSFSTQSHHENHNIYLTCEQLQNFVSSHVNDFRKYLKKAFYLNHSEIHKHIVRNAIYYITLIDKSCSNCKLRIMFKLLAEFLSCACTSGKEIFLL